MSKQEIKPKTSISAHLQELIDVANNSISTLKEQIIEIYETAKKEGFTPQEARILIEVKVVKFSDRYLRRILPDEAKDQSKVRVSKDFEDEDFIQDNGEEVVNPTTDHVKFAEQVPQIPAPATEIKDAESEELHDLPEPTEGESEGDIVEDPEIQTARYDPEEINTKMGKEVIQLRDQVEKLTEENTRLRMQKVGTLANKFDFEYDYEMPSGDIVPFIVTVFPDKKDGYIRLNKEKIARIEKKEARTKK